MPKWTFDLKPSPASRPKVSRYGTYYGKNYTTFRRMAAVEIPKVIKSHAKYPLTQALVVHAIAYAEKPKSSDKDWPRGDVDNYAKAILDACNGLVWEDDDCIILLVTSKAWAPKAKVELHVHLTTPKHAAKLLAQVVKAAARIEQETT